MGRMHGEHKKEFAGRQLFKSLQRRPEEDPPEPAIPQEPILSCFCDWYPCGHTHSDLDTKISLQRFRLAGPPLTQDEARRLYEDRA